MKRSHEVLIIGGGTAGLTVAAQLSNLDSPPDIGLIEPSDKHYYQPIWTLVGAGVFPKEISVRPEADYVPYGVDWIQDRAVTIDPDDATVQTAGGDEISYQYLVVCPGLQINWKGIPGLAETLGKNGVCSNYGYENSANTWKVLRSMESGGRALFTQPNTPVKCGGAPQKIMYLTGDYSLRNDLSLSIDFFSPGTVVFGVPEFERTLKKVIARYGIDFHLRHELVAVDGPSQEATVEIRNEDGEVLRRETYGFDMLHVVPPQSAHDFISQSPIANTEGWVEVDHTTLQHTRYSNIFSLGDTAGTPNAKTGAAVRKQAPVVVHNLGEVMKFGEIRSAKEYNGYSSCPLVTGYGKLVLAEFDYENRPDPSFPFDTTQERYSMYALKAYALPELYWNGMLRGRA